jgi:RNA-directed DNA polymerase
MARTATHRYKTYQIPKASGGLRTIDHPARELKLLQAWLVDNVLAHLPVHPAAFAYRKGRGILNHAQVHAAQNYLLKVDFREFFPSITGRDISALLKTNARLFTPPLDLSDDPLVRSLACKNDRLTIGAPSSPALSNAVMFDFDTYWAERCGRNEVIYSRYADDLYFSTNRPNVLSTILNELRADLMRRDSPKLYINDAKTAFSSRKRRRLVTGLVLASNREVSLGRSFKRRIKSMVFKHGLGGNDADQIARIRGLLSYARSIEPRFITALQRKFGTNVNGLL